MKRYFGRAIAVAMTALLITSAASAGEGNVFTKFMRWTGYGIGSGYHTCPCPKPVRGWKAGACATGHCSPVVASPCEFGCAKRPERDVCHQQYAVRKSAQFSPERSEAATPADVAWHPNKATRAMPFASPDRVAAPPLSRAANADTPRFGKSPWYSSDRAPFGK